MWWGIAYPFGAHVVAEFTLSEADVLLTMTVSYGVRISVFVGQGVRVGRNG